MAELGGVAMTNLFLLSETQMRRIEPFLPLAQGAPRVDDPRVISGIVVVIKDGLRWRDAPREYGPHKPIYNQFVRWSRLGVFNKIFAELTRKVGKLRRLMIDVTQNRCAGEIPASSTIRKLTKVFSKPFADHEACLSPRSLRACFRALSAAPSEFYLRRLSPMQTWQCRQ